jgi:xanthine/CO dehydrogenase XdhC/CoxF family maturation factor
VQRVVGGGCVELEVVDAARLEQRRERDVHVLCLELDAHLGRVKDNLLRHF